MKTIDDGAVRPVQCLVATKSTSGGGGGTDGDAGGDDGGGNGAPVISVVPSSVMDRYPRRVVKRDDNDALVMAQEGKRRTDLPASRTSGIVQPAGESKAAPACLGDPSPPRSTPGSFGVCLLASPTTHHFLHHNRWETPDPSSIEQPRETTGPPTPGICVGATAAASRHGFVAAMRCTGRSRLPYTS